MPLLLDFLMVPFLAVFAFVTSYEDVRCGRIRNRWIAAAMVYPLAAILSQAGYLALTGGKLNPGYLSSFGLNAALSLAAGVAFWLANILTAADAKLFFAYSVAVPLHWYRRVLFPVFPGFSILFNAVLPLAAFYVLVVVRKLIAGRDAAALRAALRENLRPRQYVGLLLFLFGFSWLVSWLLGSVLGEPGYLMLIATMAASYWIARRLLGRRFILFSEIAAAARFVVDFRFVLSQAFLIGFLPMFLFIAVAFVLLLNLGSLAFSESITLSRLKPGMVLAEDVRRMVGGKAVVHERGRRRFLFAERAEGLTGEEIALLGKLRRNKTLPVKALRISQVVPFALFLAIGALLVALIGGDMLLLV